MWFLYAGFYCIIYWAKTEFYRIFIIHKSLMFSQHSNKTTGI